MLRVSLLILALVLPASACLNDNEIARAENEFRARYAIEPSAEAPVTRNVVIPLALGCVGIMFAVLWRRRARRG